MAREDLRAVIGIYDAGLGRRRTKRAAKAILARSARATSLLSLHRQLRPRGAPDRQHHQRT